MIHYKQYVTPALHTTVIIRKTKSGKLYITYDKINYSDYQAVQVIGDTVT